MGLARKSVLRILTDYGTRAAPLASRAIKGGSRSPDRFRGEWGFLAKLGVQALTIVAAIVVTIISAFAADMRAPPPGYPVIPAVLPADPCSDLMLGVRAEAGSMTERRIPPEVSIGGAMNTSNACDRRRPTAPRAERYDVSNRFAPRCAARDWTTRG